ncbi:unnamed protein product [Mucor circinelloides]
MKCRQHMSINNSFRHFGRSKHVHNEKIPIISKGLLPLLLQDDKNVYCITVRNMLFFPLSFVTSKDSPNAAYHLQLFNMIAICGFSAMVRYKFVGFLNIAASIQGSIVQIASFSNISNESAYA